MNFHLNLRSSLIAAFVASGIIPLLIVAVVSYRSSSTGFTTLQAEATDALSEQATKMLVSQRDLKKKQIVDYFGSIQNQILTFSENGMVVDSLKGFRNSFAEFQGETKLTKEQLDTQRRELLTYYTGPFSNNYRELNDGTDPNASQYFDQLDDDSIALQHAYIFANANELGSKHLLDAAKDDSEYSKLHRHVHPIIRDYLDKFGYYDIFLVDTETGDIVYSVFKELDYTTSLIDGPYAKTNFGEAFRRANAEGNKDAVALVDFDRYTPSYEAPAGFIASPVFDGDKKIGVAMFQMPVDRILDIMGTRAGMGETGETILVGPDYLMRSDSHVDPEAHSLQASWKYPEAGKVDSAATQSIFQKGETGTIVAKDYRGEEALLAFTPVDLNGLTYGIVAKMDTSETFQSSREIKAGAASVKRSVVLWSIGLALAAGLLVAGAAYYLSGKITRPIIAAAGFAKRIAGGDLTTRCDVQAKAEVGDLINAMNDMSENLASLLGDVVNTANQLGVSSGELNGTAEDLSEGAHATTERASSVAAAAEEMSVNMNNMATATEQVSGNITFVATSMDEMSSTISEIARNAEKASSAVSSAAKLAEDSNQRIDQLGTSAAEIGSVIETIQDIAEQTNLLALNATIEAARAGDAGKGFAVVATEVKELARQTADATDDIRSRIEAIQSSTGAAVESISQIGTAINDVSDVSKTIASAVEEQGIATKNIAQNIGQAANASETVTIGVKEAAEASQEISKHISGVSQAAKESTGHAVKTKEAGGDISGCAEGLRSVLSGFQLGTDSTCNELVTSGSK